MSEDGDILGMPFKLERRSLQDQIFGLQGQIQIFRRDLKNLLEGHNIGLEAIKRQLTDHDERLRALEAGLERGVQYGWNELWPAGIEGVIKDLQWRTETQLRDIEVRLKALGAGPPSKPRFEWTTTTPVRPGFYWVVFREGRPEVVALTEDHKMLLVNRTGWSVCMATLAKEAEGAWWYGPIEPPEGA